jgi:hypothetical protein
MKVRRICLAGVSQQSDHLTGGDPLPGANADAARLQMSIECVNVGPQAP